MKLLASLLIAVSTLPLTAEVITPDFVKPMAVATPAPDYPEFLRASGTEGRAIVEATLDTTGALVGVRAVHATNPAFAGAARQAVGSWKFTPALQDGTPVTMRLRIPVAFRLDGGTRIGELQPIAMGR